MVKEVYEFHPRLFAIITASFPWLPHRLTGYVRMSTGSRVSFAYRGIFSAILALTLSIFFVIPHFSYRFGKHNFVIFLNTIPNISL